jgi:hypothetical protein
MVNISYHIISVKKPKPEALITNSKFQNPCRKKAKSIIVFEIHGPGIWDLGFETCNLY